MRRHARAAGRLNRPPWAQPVAPLPAGCRPAPWRGTAPGRRSTALGQGRRVVLVLRQPDADGGRDAQAVDAAGQRLGETPGHVLAQRDGAAGVVAGQHGGEFLAADAGQQHRRPQHAARDVGEGLEHQIAGLVAVAVVDGLELVRSKASTASGSRPGRRRSGAGPARRTSGGCPAGSGSRSAIPAAAGHASLRAPASSVMGSTMEYSTPSYMVILLASICAAGPSWPPTRAG